MGESYWKLTTCLNHPILRSKTKTFVVAIVFDCNSNLFPFFPPSFPFILLYHSPDSFFLFTFSLIFLFFFLVESWNLKGNVFFLLDLLFSCSLFIFLSFCTNSYPCKFPLNVVPLFLLLFLCFNSLLLACYAG